MRTRGEWLERLAVLIAELAPELGPVALDEQTRLGEDLGLDSLAFEELFARLRAEASGPVDAITWFNALEASEGRVGVLIDLLCAEAGVRGA